MAFSIGAAFISLKLNRKLLYPPTRNSPGCSRTSPNVTRGPTASMSRIISEHGTARWPPSDPSAAVGMSCAPQHMNTKRSGSATSVAPVISSTTTTRENSNATVTPRRLTGESRALVTTTETYISRAAAAPPDVAASTAPTRTRSSDGREVHVVTANLSAPEVRSGPPASGRGVGGRLEKTSRDVVRRDGRGGGGVGSRSRSRGGRGDVSGIGPSRDASGGVARSVGGDDRPLARLRPGRLGERRFHERKTRRLADRLDGRRIAVGLERNRGVRARGVSWALRGIAGDDVIAIESLSLRGRKEWSKA